MNDAEYTVAPCINGKSTLCYFYKTWLSMLERCYNAGFQVRNPTYVGCSVCEEWLTFSNFKSWMENQDWQGKQLDKDLLLEGNKIYSPNACGFVNRMTNLFTTDHRAARGEWPIGVTFNKKSRKFHANCCNPFTKKQEHLGSFTCQEQAHEAWCKRKHELALQLADLQTDERIAKVLRERYTSLYTYKNL